MYPGPARRASCPTCSFPDLWSQIVEIADCTLLNHYFTGLAALWADADAAERGPRQGPDDGCLVWDQTYSSLLDPDAPPTPSRTAGCRRTRSTTRETNPQRRRAARCRTTRSRSGAGARATASPAARTTTSACSTGSSSCRPAQITPGAVRRPQRHDRRPRHRLRGHAARAPSPTPGARDRLPDRPDRRRRGVARRPDHRPPRPLHHRVAPGLQQLPGARPARQGQRHARQPGHLDGRRAARRRPGASPARSALGADRERRPSRPGAPADGHVHRQPARGHGPLARRASTPTARDRPHAEKVVANRPGGRRRRLLVAGERVDDAATCREAVPVLRGAAHRRRRADRPRHPQVPPEAASAASDYAGVTFTDASGRSCRRPSRPASATGRRPASGSSRDPPRGSASPVARAAARSARRRPRAWRPAPCAAARQAPGRPPAALPARARRREEGARAQARADLRRDHPRPAGPRHARPAQGHQPLGQARHRRAPRARLPLAGDVLGEVLAGEGRALGDEVRRRALEDDPRRRRGRRRGRGR